MLPSPSGPYSVLGWCTAQCKSRDGERRPALERMSLPGPAPAAKQRAMRSITLRPEAHRRLAAGHPWVYSNELVMDPAARAIEPGSLVRLLRADGRPLALATFNPHTLIAA